VPALVGRSAECAMIEQLLDGARNSSGGALIVTGDPGMGKTALLSCAQERAGGMRVLRAHGAQAESQLPFAGLHALLRPALHLLPTLPAAQADELGGAFGLGAPQAPSRFLVAAAVLGLLSELADDAPVLCLLDDTQWLDRASLDALLFAARRIDADPIAIIMCARTGELEPSSLPEIRLGPIPAQDATRLLDRQAAVLDDASRRRLIELAAGNPLALIELARQPAVAAVPPAVGRAPVSLGARLESAFLARVGRLGADARRLLLLVAADDSMDLATLLSAAASLGIGADALEEVERDRLLQVYAERVEFVHPLIGSAVYRAALFADRRAAHQAIANAVPAGQHDRRTWHLAATTAEPDEALALALEDAAFAAQARAGHDAAAAALARSAELSPDPHERARRFLDAAEQAWEGGRAAWASDLVQRGGRAASGDLVAGRVAALRGRFETRRGVMVDGYELLLAGADALAAVAPDRATISLHEAMEAAFRLGDLTLMAEVGRRVGDLPENDQTPASAHAAGMAALLAGDLDRATPLLHTAVTRGEQSEHPESLFWAGIAAGYTGDPLTMTRFARRAVARARITGALGTLARVLELSAIAALPFDPAAAETDATEGLRLARETDQPPAAAMHLALLTTVAAVRGDETRTAECAQAVRALAAAHGLGFPDGWATSAVALLELGLGRPEQALVRLQEPSVAGNPGIVLATTPDLVEAAVRAGHPERAVPAMTVFESWAASSRSASTAATLHRCRALLAAGDDATEHFQQALAAHSRFGPSYDRLRTLLLTGEHLRRERRRVEARPYLREAIDGFVRLGARPWEERARAELRASGETARRRQGDDDMRQQLTPQERQIAVLVAEGASNKEVAAQLYLSPRTVDAHLRNVFAKLGIASRGQLRQAELTP